ncbi:MAG: stage V sporulation protein D [Firmicutes bacterium]|nr:stage V sporulation protein D [Bacillota bacterium]
MSSPTVSTKKRLILMLFVVSIAMFALIGRIGYFQIVRGDELKRRALEQWTRDIPIEPKRGIIYDRNGKKLAISVSTDTVWCNPAEINKKKAKDIAKDLSDILEIDQDILYKKITKRQSSTLIKRWIEKQQADKIRNLNIRGIEVVSDNKRYYPLGNFASHILGFTNVDNEGQYGVEKTYNKYLTGIPGRWIKTVDGRQKELPYNNEKIYEPEDGLGVVLTLDETIQHFAEKSALEALVKNKAKNVSIIVMQPKTGDILALANKPDYDPNDKTKLLFDPKTPWMPLNEQEMNYWEDVPWSQKEKLVYDSWRNFPVNDFYEPGSTFKIITAAAGLEENVVSPDSQFYCDGYVQQVKGANIKCWRYYNPHGSQSFVEGAQNSCNEVFVEVGLRLGQEKMYKYVKGFGFGEKTRIDLTGEASGIVNSPDNMREVNLATVSFGQGISVTPLQLITGVSAVANGGNLMEPRIVKQLVDNKGNIKKTFEPKKKRRVISEETSDTMLNILESVVSEGTGKKAYVRGYKVGGKTGTAQKVIDGRYASGKYIASFMAVAPTDDPEIAVLVVIDEPSNGIYYGGQIAAPVAGQVIKDSLNYLNIKPDIKENKDSDEATGYVVIPDVRNKTITEAGKILSQLGLEYSTETLDVQKNTIIIDQVPFPGTKVKRGSMIDLFVNTKYERDNTVIVPNLTGKNYKEVTNMLDNLSLRYKLEGEGIVTNQKPNAGTKVDYNSLIEVKFDNANHD